MSDDIGKILDLCLEKLARGETIEQCLSDFPEFRAELEPLLKTASFLNSTPMVSPSDSFRQSSQARLVSKINALSSKPKCEPKRSELPGESGWWRFWQNLSARPLIPVVVIILIMLGTWLLVPNQPSPITPIVNNAESTLSVLKGQIDVLTSDSNEWQAALDGIKLNPGSNIRTAADSRAVLTFIDGTTTTLEPSTEIKLIKSEYTGENIPKILLSQRYGKTWNYVQKTGEKLPNFEIHTATANIAAQGTAFSAELDKNSALQVIVKEGNVAVTSGENSLTLSADQQTSVKPGSPLMAAMAIPAPKSELVVSLGAQAVTSICEPGGSSTGYLPNGVSFNQIAGSKSIISETGQVTRVSEPSPGEYLVVVRNISGDTVPVRIQLQREGQAAIDYTEAVKGIPGSSWLIRVNVGTGISASAPSMGKVRIEPLGDMTPEKVVQSQSAGVKPLPYAQTQPTTSIQPVTTPSYQPTQSPQVTPSIAPTKTLETAPTTITTTPTPIVTPTLTPKPSETTIPPNTAVTTTPIPTKTPTPNPTTSTAPQPANTDGTNTGTETTTSFTTSYILR